MFLYGIVCPCASYISRHRHYSYFLAQIVPVIPFALTTRVGVAEEDGALKILPLPSFPDIEPFIHSPALGLRSHRRLRRCSPGRCPYFPFIPSSFTHSRLNFGSDSWRPSRSHALPASPPPNRTRRPPWLNSPALSRHHSRPSHHRPLAARSFRRHRLDRRTCPSSRHCGP